VVYQTNFRWHIYSAIFVPEITGIGQLLLKLSMVVGWYPFWDTLYICYMARCLSLRLTACLSVRHSPVLYGNVKICCKKAVHQVSYLSDERYSTFDDCLVQHYTRYWPLRINVSVPFAALKYVGLGLCACDKLASLNVALVVLTQGQTAVSHNCSFHVYARRPIA